MCDWGQKTETNIKFGKFSLKTNIKINGGLLLIEIILHKIVSGKREIKNNIVFMW